MSIQRPLFIQPATPPFNEGAVSIWSMVPPASLNSSNPVLPGIRTGAPGGRFQPMLTPPSQVELKREEEARLLADRFCKASIRRFGADEEAMQLTLKKVADHHLQPQFNQAVRRMAQQQGLQVRGAGEVVDKELGGNFFTRFFKKSPRQACHDYLEVGRDTHSSTPWEYRRYGMYRSGSDFVGVIKRHPVVSFSVIAAVSYLGNRFPFIGGVSGIGLIAWGGIASAMNEYKAAKLPDKMSAQKKAHYEQSGENLAAVLMTVPGYHGITEGTRAGFGLYNEAKKAESIPASLWKATSLKNTSDEYKNLSQGRPSNAVIPDEVKASEKNKSRLAYWANRGLFVVGLFDNVLLPFNWLADQMQEKK
jgi:hypothetical protein